MNRYRLQAACDVVRDIFGLEITELSDTKEMADFCGKYQIFSTQKWMETKTLEKILKEADRNAVSHIEDDFHMEALLFYAEDTPVIAGPYLREEMTTGKCLRLLHQLGIENLSPEELVLCYGAMPVIAEDLAVRIPAALFQAAELEIQPVRELKIDSEKGIDCEMKTNREEAAEKQNSDRKNKGDEDICLHYETERCFRQAISEGNRPRAIRYFREMRQHAPGLWADRRQNSINGARVAAGITRAIARTAAYDAGLPAPLIHRITFAAGREIEIASSEEQIDRITRNMIEKFCEIIQEQKQAKYSAMTQSVIYEFRRNYAAPLRLSEIAAELGISENYMIRRFREETGQTPAVYLKNIRLEEAAHLLAAGRQPVQEISAAVGIPDANYFSKLFREKYGVTPREYRK